MSDLSCDITNEMVFSILAPRNPESHKGTYGKLLAVCGCSEYRGAAALAVSGALRAGAGIVSLAAPECVIQSIASRILEAVFVPLPDRAALADAVQRNDVFLAGCGMHDDAAVADTVRFLLRNTKGTFVLDAGGLCSLAAEPESMRSAAGRLIITPHPGEMARISGKSIQEVLAQPEACALEMAQKLSCVVVLKGHRTRIASPDGSVFRNTTGNAGLARGGSGDILAGMIAGFAAQGLTPQQAAVCGVYLHGLAADHCAARLSQQGMLPEDILHDLCCVFLENNR